MSQPDGGPAFPQNVFIEGRQDLPDPAGFSDAFEPGMTLRDAFALSALQGLLASGDSRASFDVYARDAWKQADAMLKERSR